METEKKRSSCTDWTETGVNDGSMNKTNFKKVRVKFTNENVVAESCCCRDDTFNLSFGIRMAWLRGLIKAWEKKKSNFEDVNKVKMADEEIAAIEANIKHMIDSLDAKE